MPRKGSRGNQKAPGTAVDPRNGQKVALTIVEGGQNPMRFDPPANLGERARTQWDDYWEDPISYTITSADRVMLIRWIETVDRYFTIMKLADSNPITKGSQRQDVVSPLYPLGMKMMAEISRFEAQLGIGPKNRAALGIAVLSERRSLQDLNKGYEPEGGTGDDEDPRIKIVHGETER